MNKKQQAIEYYKNRLLNSEVADSIAKIIVFGSVAKRNYKNTSDVDILLLAAKNLKAVEEISLIYEFETALKFGESIETITRCIDWLKYPQSTFAYRILKEGKEVYKMDEKEVKKQEAQNYFDLAEEYIKHAEYDLKGNIYRGAIEAAYNAVELCAKALLLKKIRNLPKTHSGIIIKFNEYYIKSGKVPQEIGKEFRRLLKKRNEARYEPHIEFTKEEAEKSVKFATDTIAILKEYL